MTAERPKTIKDDTPKPTQGTQSGPTAGEKNALAKAKQYLEYSAFSYSGLIDQLEYEGFSKEEATYGADNCGADWNEQAVEKAKSYIKHSAFSHSGLIDQLEVKPGEKRIRNKQQRYEKISERALEEIDAIVQLLASGESE